MELMFSVYGLAKLCFLIGIGLFIWSYKLEPKKSKLVFIGFGVVGLLFSPIKIKPVSTSQMSNSIIAHKNAPIKDMVYAKPDLKVSKITDKDLK
jgi:ABC-type transport system involved in multi-copper enzyme maturation permease subunit